MNYWNILQQRSLKARVTFFTLAIFLISIWLLAFYASRMLREDMQRLLGEQQFTTTSLMATEIDQELSFRLNALEKIAGRVSPAILDNTAALQSLLEQHLVFQGLFNGGVVVCRLDGTAIAEVPLSVGRIGVNYMDVDSIAAALKEGESTIGRPVMGKVLHAAVFPMSVPIRDTRGNVIGALTGVTNLGKPSFLDLIVGSRYGTTGGYLLVAPQYRTVVTATDKSRLMEALPAPGIYPMIDRAVQGDEGFVVGVDALGEEVLASRKGIPAAGWHLAAVLPTAEAFAPIRTMQQRVLLAAIFLTLLAGALIWWVLKRQLLPLLVAARTLAIRSDTNRPPQPLPIARQDEIGELIGGFNRLLGILGQREEALRENERLLRESHNIAGMGSYVLDIPTGLWDGSDLLDTLLGIGEAYERSIAGWVALIHPDDRAMISDYLRSEVFGQGRDFNKAYRIIRHDDLAERWVHGYGRLEFDAQRRPLKMYGTIQDITEYKRYEVAIVESRNLLMTIIDAVPVRVFWKDRDSRFLGCNMAFAKDAGMTHPKDVVGKDDYQMGWATQAELYRADDRAVMETGVAKLFYDELMTTPSGRLIWIRTSKVLLRNQDNETLGLLGIYEDITERKQAEEKLRIAATAFESQQAMVVTDRDGVIIRVNRAFTESIGYTSEEAVGQTPRLLRSDRHNKDFYREMRETLHHTGEWQGEVWERRKSGEEYLNWLNISAVKDGDGAVTHYVGTHYDITERKKAEERIKVLAFFDPLTDLPNRTLLLDRLRLAITGSGDGSYGAMLFIDLDNFKTLNDTLGHHMGDLLLQQVAQRLTTCVRTEDTVARLGGDEFVVLLSDLGTNKVNAAAQAESVSHEILCAFNQMYQLKETAYHITPSIGATLFVGQQTSIDDLMKQVDLAMYRSKAAGRNTVHFFDPAMESAVTERAALEGDLRRGIDEKQFLLHYQAQVAGEDRVTGAEVLLRWHHPQRGLVSPAKFIFLAEETGLILPLGRWVLETACTQLAIWATRPEMAHLTIAVNVSVHQFHQHDFVDQVLAVLNNTGANPQRLKLELTESLLVSNVDKVIEKMFALKSKGVGFSLDDFGTGYSSLSYLKRMPLDQLKIDQSFVRDVLTDPNDAAIANTIIALAKSLGLGVIAEGVETESQRDFLAGSGCYAYQGYFFGRPVPLEEFEKLVKRVDAQLEDELDACSVAV